MNIAVIESDIPEEKQLAYARLIAAAPDLLAALEALIEFADNDTPVRPGSFVVYDARAAIAKAKGL